MHLLMVLMESFPYQSGVKTSMQAGFVFSDGQLAAYLSSDYGVKFLDASFSYCHSGTEVRNV